MSEKVILVILDGWGNGKNYAGNAIKLSKNNFVDSLHLKYPMAYLETSGEAVGLPDGQMGNSEVGHLNIGAGRVVFQQLVLISQAFKNQTVAQNKVLKEAIEYAKNNNKSIHLIGLVSDGGVHSSLDHLIELSKIIDHSNVKNIFIHGFTDGRDTDPKSGLGYFNKLQDSISKTQVKIASIIGRYYAMDRDNRWERVKQAYDLLINGVGSRYSNPTDAINNSYSEGLTDEFMKPIVISEDGMNPISTIKPDDVVIFFNFRTDRGRELTQVLSQRPIIEHQMTPLPLRFITMTTYDESFKNVETLFSNDDLTNTLGEVLEKNHKKQVRIAETEKYPHVTFFFSGGREKEFINESRKLCPSPKVSTYDLKPEMSAVEIKNTVIETLETNTDDFIVVNFANPDMVGHTGVLPAVVKAIETVDNCAEEIVKKAINKNWNILITADHGNSEYMINEDGTPNTAHTTNEVPIYLISNNKQLKIQSGKLADIAPTILELMGIEKPTVMTGESLIIK